VRLCFRISTDDEVDKRGHVGRRPAEWLIKRAKGHGDAALPLCEHLSLGRSPVEKKQGGCRFQSFARIRPTGRSSPHKCPDSAENYKFSLFPVILCLISCAELSSALFVGQNHPPDLLEAGRTSFFFSLKPWLITEERHFVVVREVTHAAVVRGGQQGHQSWSSLVYHCLVTVSRLSAEPPTHTPDPRLSFPPFTNVASPLCLPSPPKSRRRACKLPKS
jgi:hypothetical protein